MGGGGMMRRGGLFWMAMAIAAAVAAFVVKYEVRDLEDQLAALESDLVQSQESIHVLKAEWSYLNRPERLTELAERYLDLVPMGPAQMTTLIDVPYRPDGIPGFELSPNLTLVKFEVQP
jgi:cell division protein FtsL